MERREINSLGNLVLLIGDQSNVSRPNSLSM